MIQHLEFILSSLGSLVSNILYYSVAIILSVFIGPNVANFLGLVSSGVFNYHVQPRIFTMKGGTFNKQMRIRFLINVSITIAVTELMYILLKRLVWKYRPDIPKKHEHWTIFIRIIIGAIVYVCITFPMRKYFVYVD